MKISVITGAGEAQTDLAAFDRALYVAGIGDVNLLPLSSVIPPGAQVVQQRPCLSDDDWGKKLFVVLAQHRELAIGAEAWAGIGWVQDPDDGAGLFVEHHGGSKAYVESQIHESLTSMVAYRDRDFDDITLVTTGIVCKERPVCALVAAVYAVEGWD